MVMGCRDPRRDAACFKLAFIHSAEHTTICRRSGLERYRPCRSCCHSAQQSRL